MAFFDWFPWVRKRSRLALAIYLDEAGRLEDLVAEIADDLRRGMHVIFAGHFRDSLLQVGDRLAARGVPFTTKSSWSETDARVLIANKTATALAILVEAFPKVDADAPRPEAMSGSRVLSFRLVDLHVQRAQNERAERYARSLPCPVRLTASTSLENPLLAEFAKPWVKTMMERLGLQPGQKIESPMLTRQVWRVSQQLERRVHGNVACNSLGEWMQKNLRRD